MNRTRADCEALTNSVLSFARLMLERHGVFLPFGGAMLPDGQITAIGGYDGGEHPPAVDVIHLLRDAFIDAAKNGQYMATALAYDVRVRLAVNGEKTDPMAVSLNHRDNYSVVVMFPYRLENGKLILSDPFAQAGENDIFPRGNGLS